MSTVQAVLDSLKEMGFDEERAKRALNKTGWKGVEPAMEWLLAHPDPADDSSDDDEAMAVDEAAAAAAAAAAPPKKELTAEEKAEQLAKLEELRIKKRNERLEREKQEALEKEKKRVKEGKSMTEIKQQLADQEIKLAAEQRRREKQETQLAKERVRAQIEADKQARREREAERRGEPAAPAAAPAAPAATAAATPKKDYDETRLQIRLASGSALVHKFKTKETLSAVRLWVQLQLQPTASVDAPPTVRFMTSFPKKVFGEEDYETPLEALGLVPSAVLIVMK